MAADMRYEVVLLYDLYKTPYAKKNHFFFFLISIMYHWLNQF